MTMSTPMKTRPPRLTDRRLALAVLFAAAVLAAAVLWLGADSPWPARAWWQQQLAAWEALHHSHPSAFFACFVVSFVLLSALALPGCAPLALLAGSAFGAFAGTLIVGVASTAGALISFLVARYLARERVRRWLGARGHLLERLDRRMARQGRLWLFWLRLVPLVPYPVINPLLGLSQLAVARFFWPSLAGLTLGSLPYVYAGQSLHVWLLHGDASWLLPALALLVLVAAWLAARALASRSIEGVESDSSLPGAGSAA
jgi:uncharacterized membrane protein YdjX (TVP38/TMEM64 family)